MRCVARLPTSYRSPKTCCGLICRACATRNLIAAFKHSMSSSSSNGLLRKPTAPLSNARIRYFSFGKAVIKMTGVWYPCDRNASCNSSPFSPGICKSVIRHVVSAIRSDSRKCAADMKATPLYPNDSTSSRIPSRASESSSTIEINGDSDISTSDHQIKQNTSSTVPHSKYLIYLKSCSVVVHLLNTTGTRLAVAGDGGTGRGILPKPARVSCGFLGCVQIGGRLGLWF
jgi:hypothetical protein